MLSSNKYNSCSDIELIELLKKGNIDAFELIHKRYYGILYIHAYKMLANRDEVKDVLQEVFIYVWDKRADMAWGINLKAYLYTSVRNKILNFISHKNIRSKYAESFQGLALTINHGGDEDYCLKELILLIDKEVNALPSQMRLIFQLSRNANLSHKEIADQLNISPLTVKKQINNSIKVLRMKLGSFCFFLLF